MSKGYARLTPLDADGESCGEPFFLTEGVDISWVGDNLSIGLPAGTPVCERYQVEAWLANPVCDVIAPEGYVMDMNSPVLRAMWEPGRYEARDDE